LERIEQLKMYGLALSVVSVVSLCDPDAG